MPHALLFVPDWQVPLLSQQPLAQLLGLHVLWHLPLTQICPVIQVTQVPPPLPHTPLLVPDWQVPLASQQPAQLVGPQMTHAPATQIWLAEQQVPLQHAWPLGQQVVPQQNWFELQQVPLQLVWPEGQTHRLLVQVPEQHWDPWTQWLPRPRHFVFARAGSASLRPRSPPTTEAAKVLRARRREVGAARALVNSSKREEFML